MGKGYRLWQVLKGKGTISFEPPPPVYCKDGQFYHAVCRHPLIRTDEKWEDKMALYCVWCKISIMVRFLDRRKK